MRTNINPVSIHGLGAVSNKSRLNRVTLPTSAGVFEVLKLKRKLIGTENFNGIRISADRTIQQRNYFKDIISDLKSRRESSETDLFIKFIYNIYQPFKKNDKKIIQHQTIYQCTIEMFEA